MDEEENYMEQNFEEVE